MLIVVVAAAEEFVYLILLASWISEGVEWEVVEPLDLIEYFAGVSRICRLATWNNYQARGFELKYDKPPYGCAQHSGMQHRSCYDFNGEAGFLLSG